MSRYHSRGRDPWQTMPETQWQRERRLGPILPMSEGRPGLLRRMLGGSRGFADAKAAAVKVARESSNGAQHLKLAARKEKDGQGALVHAAEEAEANSIATAIEKMEMKG